MQQKAAVFEKKYHVTVRLIPGSTGRLYNQIVQGAPYDVFIAADAQRPTMLAQQGRVLEQRAVGQGYLGVMLRHQVIAEPERLADISVHHIAIANPDVAPFGKRTRDALLRLGLWQQLKHKFVYTGNALQASMMVNKGLVDSGFVPVSSGDISISVIHYLGVVLADRVVARQWLNSVATSPLRQLALQVP